VTAYSERREQAALLIEDEKKGEGGEGSEFIRGGCQPMNYWGGRTDFEPFPTFSRSWSPEAVQKSRNDPDKKQSEKLDSFFSPRPLPVTKRVDFSS